MHARIDQLLALQDSTFEDPHIAGHVDHCAECTERLSELARAREALRALPSIDPPTAAWARVQAAMAVPNRALANVAIDRRRRTRQGVAFAAFAGIAAFALAIGIQLVEQTQDPPPSSTVRATESVPSDSLAHLIEQSRELDALLQIMPHRPTVERVSTAATIDTIEERIQWLDVRLSYASESDLNETQAQRLWRERIELMDSLVKVRYAQTGHATF